MILTLMVILLGFFLKLKAVEEVGLLFIFLIFLNHPISTELDKEYQYFQLTNIIKIKLGGSKVDRISKLIQHSLRSEQVATPIVVYTFSTISKNLNHKFTFQWVDHTLTQWWSNKSTILNNKCVSNKIQHLTSRQ